MTLLNGNIGNMQKYQKLSVDSDSSNKMKTEESNFKANDQVVEKISADKN